MLVDTGLFSADFEKLLMGDKVKLTQIYRNLLLTERYRIKEGLEGFVFSSAFAEGASVNRRGNQFGYRVPEAGV